MLRRKNDILLKSAFEDAFADLLRFYIPDADDLFDLERGFEFMDKELLEIAPDTEQAGGSRYTDMLVKAWLRNGNEEWILIHIEIQGRNDDTFARRMYTYHYRVLDRFNVRITAFAVFTGDKSQQRPAVFESRFLGTELVYRYNTYHILDHTASQLLGMNNRFALVILAAQKVLLSGKISEEELATQRLTIAKALIESGQYNHEQIKKFSWFLRNFIYIPNREINSIFDRQVDTLTGKPNKMDIFEAVNYINREEGKLETKEKIIINLIQQLGLTNEQAAKVAETSVEAVQAIREKLQA